MKIPRYYAQGKTPVARGPQPEDAVRQTAALAAGIGSVAQPVMDYLEARDNAEATAETAAMSARYSRDYQDWYRSQITTPTGGVKALSPDTVERFDAWHRNELSRVRKDTTSDKAMRASVTKLNDAYLKTRADLIMQVEQERLERARISVFDGFQEQQGRGDFQGADITLREAWESNILEESEYRALREENLQRAQLQEVYDRTNDPRVNLDDLRDTIEAGGGGFDQAGREKALNIVETEIKRKEKAEDDRMEQYALDVDNELYQYEQEGSVPPPDLLQRINNVENVSARSSMRMRFQQIGLKGMDDAIRITELENRIWRMSVYGAEDPQLTMTKLELEAGTIRMSRDMTEETYQSKLDQIRNIPVDMIRRPEYQMANRRLYTALTKIPVVSGSGVDFEAILARAMQDTYNMQPGEVDPTTGFTREQLMERMRDAEVLHRKMFDAAMKRGIGFDPAEWAEEQIERYNKQGLTD